MLRTSLAILIMTMSVSHGGDVEFIEDFALAKDRAAVLKQLIPGTEDYYYYHALHSLNTEQWDQAKALFAPWHTRFHQTQRLTEMQTRLALLTYNRDPKATLAYLTDKLGIHFNHEKEILGQVPDYPTKLDPKSITRATLLARSFSGWQYLENFEDSALGWLAGETLTPIRRRVLLQRLKWPDAPNLVQLVNDDLGTPNTPGFGTATPIHAQMTLVQLEQLLKLRPELLNQTHFMQTWLTKLQPGADDDWRHDPAKTSAYLDRLLGFVRKLNPSHNSLKAHVLYHKLVFDRSQGQYDKAIFLEYLALPRQQGYMAKRLLESEESRRFPSDLNANFDPLTLLPPVHNDEPVVRSYLKHFFADAESPKEFENFINDLYLKHLFAETKIELGLGEPEKWASELPPDLFAKLKERIDIDFVPTNKTYYDADEAVTLNLQVKNVPTLIVKVFEINAVNFYKEFKREIDTDINLDGLVPNSEQTFNYAEPSLRRLPRQFAFPQLNRPGVYIIDFIGAGKSSRALVRKGRLRPLVHTGTAGQVVSVVDEKNRPVTDASVWLGTTEYKPDKDGKVLIPFSTAPARQAIVLRRGDFASLDYLDHQPEQYQLVAGLHVDREQLLAQRLAKVLVRPALMLNGQPVSTRLLQDVRLRIVSSDAEGVGSATDVPNFQLFEDREAVHEFRVPPRIVSLTVTLSAKVTSLTTGAKVDVADSQTFSLNGILATSQIGDIHFARFGNDYVLEMLGRTGEVLVNRPVVVTLKHRDFKEPVNATLKTDAQGRVLLGELAEIEWVKAGDRTFMLPRDRHSYRTLLHAKAGEVIRLPWLGGDLSRLTAALFTVTDRTIIADQFDKLAVKDGMLEISGLAAGDYALDLKGARENIRIRVVEGVVRDGYVLGQLRHLELPRLAPVQIASITPDAETVKIKLAGASPFTRVHVIASRYLPEYSAFADLGKVRDAILKGVYPGFADSVYLTGRAIGDEYRYVLDRKYQKKYPGNMLDRPELLLNPWAVRSTETGEQVAQEGGAFGGSGGAMPPRPAPEASPRGVDAKAAGGKSQDMSAFLDFLADESVVLPNIVPDKDGFVTVKRVLFGTHQSLTVIVVDPLSTTVKHVSLPEQKADSLDLRLRAGLDPKDHFTQQKQVSILEKAKPFVQKDAAAGRFEVYDSVEKLYGLYATLVKDPKMAEFAFIANWPKLKPEEKTALYSKHACHELSFFLFKKDPEFFKTVIKPYLANKKDKTFLDQWLLDADLKEYATPWRHGRLNTAERVVLSQRLPGEPAKTARHLGDLLKLLPPNLEREVFLFDSSLAFGDMDSANRMYSLELGEREKLRSRLGGELKGPASPMIGGLGSMPEANMPTDPQGKPAAQKLDKNVERLQRRDEAKKELSEFQKDGESKGKDANFAQRRGAFGREDFFGNDRGGRPGLPPPLFRRVEPTMEWAENNYYKLPIQKQLANLIGVNAFWVDYAKHEAGPFLSKHVAQASQNFTEAMFALAITDLPFEAAKHETKFDAGTMTFTPGGAVIAFHEEVRAAAPPKGNAVILVNQNFYKADDHYREENGEKVEKFVTTEFVIQTVYGCQIVVTNPTPARQKLSVLVQIPVGALPLAGGRNTRTVLLDLEPYRTQTIDYYFYFPKSGTFPHFPVHVAKNETLVASAAPFTFNVVDQPSKLDTESWDYVSQNGTSDEVLAFLNRENVNALNLDKIAWRMNDAGFFQTVLTLLQNRHVYQNTLWSYSLKHGDVPAAQQYLQFSDALVNIVGDGPIQSALVTYDPIARYSYEHLEYKPLVNARTHALGARRQIVNNRFHQQYHRFLKLLSYRSSLSDTEKLAVVYYLLLQDRVEESLTLFASVNAANVPMKMQYDYCAAYLAMFDSEPKRAREIAAKYAAHPVDRWRTTFNAVLAQIDEIDGKAVKATDAENRLARQTEEAARQPSFDFTLDNKAINLNWQNLSNVTVNYYLMDVELLFSRNPFVQQTGNQFAMIKPNATKEFALPAGQAKFTVPLPEDMVKRNVLVEVVAAGRSRSVPYYANAMDVKMTDAFGQLKVTNAATGQALPKVYVKAYLRTADGQVKFHKDGYTDLRGRFDYASVSTPEKSAPEKYSILILSDEFGAVIREVNPPQQ